MIPGIDISRSRLKRNLLSLYFTNPEKEYYLRELERMLGFSVGNIRRDLLKLEKVGLFRSRKQGNLTYYSLNRDYPLYEELKSIIFKTIGVKGRLVDIVSTDEGIELAFIYGSFASGEETSTSDIDLIIIGHPEEDVLMERLEQLENKLKREINYVIYSLQEYRRRKHRKDSFMMKVLNNPKIMIKGNEAEL